MKLCQKLPEMFSKVKKGSQKYKTILLSNSKFTFAPKNTIEKIWRISEKPGRETFYKKAFSFWKNSILPSKIQLMLLKICNHQLKLNNQLKHFAVDESGIRIKPECTFCVIAQTLPTEPESYKHFFLECKHSLTAKSFQQIFPFMLVRILVLRKGKSKFLKGLDMLG